MTIQEAFEKIKDELPFESGVINESISMIEKAVEKQIPKKPKERRQFAGLYIGFCPVCSDGGNSEENYCPKCGQAIDWEGLE